MNEDEREEILEYLRKIDTGYSDILFGETSEPIVV